MGQLLFLKSNLGWAWSRGRLRAKLELTLTEMALLSEPKSFWELLSGPLSLRDHGFCSREPQRGWVLQLASGKL